jgi:hypothetical protein
MYRRADRQREKDKQMEGWTERGGQMASETGTETDRDRKVGRADR